MRCRVELRPKRWTRGARTREAPGRPHWLPSPLRPIQAWVQGAVMLCGAAAGAEGTVVCSTTAAEFGFTLGVVLSCTNTLDATFPSEGGVCGNQPDSCVFLAEAYSDLKVCLQGQAPQGFMLKPSTVLRPQVTPHLSLNTEMSQNRFLYRAVSGAVSCFCFDMRV